MSRKAVGKRMRRINNDDDSSDEDCSVASVEIRLQQQLFCVCHRLKVSLTFKCKATVHIRCKVCHEYFHCKCVGITGDTVVLFPPVGKASWICPSCDAQRKATPAPCAPFCVCRCEVLDNRWMVRCHTCREVYHGTCIGATTIEHERALRSPGVNWVCAKCST